MYQEPNLNEWKKNVEDLLNNPRARRYIGINEAALRQLAEFLLPNQDDRMRSYAESWKATTQHHKEHGLYQAMVNYFNPTEGLLVDIGCGTGGFLEALPFDSVIGVDMNQYCLQAAEELLAKQGKPVQRHARTVLTFDPRKGFVLEPYPVMEELDFSKPQLLADDYEHLTNTRRVLYNQGVKADMVSYTLHGGYTNRSPLQFIDAMKFGSESEFYAQRRVRDIPVVVEGLMDQMNTICKSGGRLFIGTRMSIGEKEGDTYVLDTSQAAADNVGQEIAKVSPKIDVVRATQIAMPQENDLDTGIKITSYCIDEEHQGEEVDLIGKNIGYSIFLVDARVR